VTDGETQGHNRYSGIAWRRALKTAPLGLFCVNTLHSCTLCMVRMWFTISIVFCWLTVPSPWQLLCADLAANLRRQTVIISTLYLRLVPLPGRLSAARQHVPQQTLQNRCCSRQVFAPFLTRIHTLRSDVSTERTQYERGPKIRIPVQLECLVGLEYYMTLPVLHCS